MTNTDRRIAALSTGQLGTFSRAQATDAGLSNRQLRSRVQSGILEQSGPNAFRLAGTPNTLHSQLRELVLDVGQPVLIAGPTAAAIEGVPGFLLRHPFHLQIGVDRNIRRNGVVFHRSEHLDPIDREEFDGWPVTSPARTLIDLARHASPAQLATALEFMVTSGLTTEDALHRRIGALRSRGRFGIPLLLSVLERREIVGGGESWLEREYLSLINRARLPRPQTQVVLARTGDHAVRVDCGFLGTNVVVELLGYRFHRTKSQMNRDAARHNALIASGRLIYQFTYDQVTTTPGEVVEQTRLALAMRRAA
jgi:very-short-patch-repair endonuclease